jgi:hypothetical protein
VFGKRHIIIWTDGSGSQLGVDPENMYVTDTIDHVGAIDRNAVVVVGEIDIVFWSYSGIRSLVRTMQERASPVADLSPHNRNYLSGAILSNQTTRGVYYARGGFVLFTVPQEATAIMLDVKAKLPDGSYRMATWAMPSTPTAWATTVSGDLFVGLDSKLGIYGTVITNAIDSVNLYLETGWVDVRTEEGRKQAVKKLRGRLLADSGLDIHMQHVVDFDTTDLDPDNDGDTFEVTESGSDFGAQYQFNLMGTASYFKFGLSVGDTSFVQSELMDLTLYTKPLRLA